MNFVKLEGIYFYLKESIFFPNFFWTTFLIFKPFIGILNAATKPNVTFI